MLNSQVPSKAVAITPSDAGSASFTSLHCGDAGTVTIQPEGGGIPVQFTVPAGGYVVCRGTKVLATGTTCTKIIGLS